MSELLQNWLNNEVGLSTNVTSFEKDFSNGYLFGEILQKFRQQDDFEGFDNRHTYEAKLSNFKRLEPTFKALGIKFNATQSNAMMASERGASLRLLYQLKMATERLLLTSEAALAKTAGQSQSAPPGGGVTKGIRVPRDKFDAHEKRFFEHRLRATCLNVKQARVDKLVHKFVQEKHVQEHVAMEMDGIVQGRIAEQRDIHRFALRERMRLNRAAKDEWTRQSGDAWEQNMMVRHARESHEITFEDRTIRNKVVQQIKVRDEHHGQAKEGIDAFESGLSNLGLSKRGESRQLNRDESSEDDDSDNQADRLLSSTTQVGTSRELVEALQSRMPNGQELEQEAGLFLRKIKESKRAGTVARNERERRRRRVLVEQQQEQDLIEESKLEEVLVEKLSRESEKEKRINYAVWRTQKYEDVVVQNRALRQQEYVARRKKDQQEALRRDQDLLQEMLETMAEQQERERLRYRAIERGRRAARMALISEECEGILELITNMAFGALQQEQLTDSGEVDETLWREWTQMFVEGIPVASSEVPADSVATMHPLLSVPPEANSEDKPGTMLDDSAFRDYVESRGQWQARSIELDAADDAAADASTGQIAAFDIKAEVESTLMAEEGKTPVSFVERITPDIDIVDGRPVNFRLGAIVAALLDRCYRQPPLPTPPPMPEAPLRLVISGKPFAGKRTLAARLAENYGLQVIDPDEVIRECLLLSKRPDAGSAEPIDMLSINDITSDELCVRCEEAGNPYVRRLQEIGHELQQLLDRGEAIDDEMYVHLVTTKIRSVYHDRLPKQDSQAIAGESPQMLSELASVQEQGSEVPGSRLASPDLSPVAEEGATVALMPESSPTTPPALEPAAEGQDAAPTQPNAMAADAGGAAAFEVFGWVLVGFPQTSQQLQLFERFLSGWVPPSATPTPEAEVKKEEAALMVPKPYEEPPPFQLVPGGYDLHVRLQVNNDEIVRRAVGRRLDPTTSLMYHLEDAPPCTKNQIIYERLVPVDDLTNSMGSLTHRMHAFDIGQPEVEGVLSYFGPFLDAPRLRDINGELTMEQVHDVVEEQVAMLLEEKKTEQARALQEKQAAADEAAAAEARRSASPESEAPLGGEDGAEPAAGDAGSGEGSKEVAEITAGAEEVPLELVKMTDLPSKVESLEDKVFKLLLQQWQEMQDNFSTSIRQLFRWHRSHLSDFRRGVHGMQHRFLQYASRTDDKQALVDTFVWKFNAFSEEYPDMRKQDPSKEELHQQADDLHDLLKEKVNSRKTENMAELENITTSQWVESHIQVLAAQIQHAVRLEAQRYHSACQLLVDFYHGALGAGISEARDPCPKIEALNPDENGVAPSTRLRRFGPAEVEAVVDAKGKKVPPAAVAEPTAEELANMPPPKWEFPFVEDLMTQARANLFKPVEWSVPATYEKKEEVVDPKAKGKAKAKAPSPTPGKGKDAPVETEKPVETPPLFVDMQQALLAERVHYQYRLSVILDWSLRRLRQATEASEKLFVQLRDWVLLRRKKELDSCLDLVDVIKEHIESEDLIKAKLTLVGAHLHRHPNVHLQAEFVPEEPPRLECSVPYRWTIDQLDQLLEAVAGSSRALGRNSLILPSQSLLSILLKLTQAPSVEMPNSVEQAPVPANWRPCDVERLQSLCAMFDQPPRSGAVDAVEFLLGVGLHHSPLGWPTIQTLQEVRSILENEVPAGSTWPDFYITEETLAGLPLFDDPKGLEAELSAKFPWETASKPSPFDRCSEQMRWLVQIFRHFQAPLRQQQAYELEVAWWDNQMRIKDEDKVCNKLLDDTMSGASTPVAMVVQPVGVDTEYTQSPAGTSEDAAPQPPPGPPPRPRTPVHLPSPPAKGAVSVRQLLSYFCLGTSLEEGLSRALAVLGPSGCNNTTPMPVVELHGMLLQLGARPTPPTLQGDGQPLLPSLDGLCREIGIDNGGREPTMTLKSFLANAQAQRMCTRLGLRARHSRAEVEKLFPKTLQAGAKIPQSQKMHI